MHKHAHKIKLTRHVLHISVSSDHQCQQQPVDTQCRSLLCCCVEMFKHWSQTHQASLPLKGWSLELDWLSQKGWSLNSQEGVVGADRGGRWEHYLCVKPLLWTQYSGTILWDCMEILVSYCFNAHTWAITILVCCDESFVLHIKLQSC